MGQRRFGIARIWMSRFANFRQRAVFAFGARVLALFEEWL
jgi:hypothetical protein